MRSLKHLKVGDTVFVVRRGSPYRQRSVEEAGLTKPVVKVGRDYLYTDEGWYQGKFRRDDGGGADNSMEYSAFAAEASYTAIKAREGREQAAAKAASSVFRWYWDRLSDAELDQFKALLDKARGVP